VTFATVLWTSYPIQLFGLLLPQHLSWSACPRSKAIASFNWCSKSLTC